MKQWIEMNRALGHFCAHTDQIGPGEPPDREMSEMTLHALQTQEIQTLEVWGRARYLLVTESPHVLRVDGEKNWLRNETKIT